MSRSSPCGRRGGVLTAALLALVALVLALGSGGTSTAGAGKKKKSYTKVTAKANKPDAEGRQTVTITMEIEKPWYAYANPVGNETFEEARTLVKLAAKGGNLEDVKITYPPGKEKKLEGVGTYRVYEDKVTITGLVRRAKGDTAPLEVTIRYMNCHPKGQCLPPETVKVPVE
jgi:thiol:disulfide interchange protein